MALEIQKMQRIYLGVDMTEEQLNKFKQRIYDPYNKAWRIIQTLKSADLSKQETWENYMKACDDFKAEFPSEIGGSIYKVLLDAGSETGRINRM